MYTNITLQNNDDKIENIIIEPFYLIKILILLLFLFHNLLNIF